MTDWQTDKAASDRVLPEIKSILGRHLIGAASIEEDQQRNTDLIVLKMEAVRIACRVRTFEYLYKYSGEFTIRSGRPSGVKTELAKIIEGWGDYLFYGFATQDGAALVAWLLGDLKVFRLWYSRQLATLPPRQCPGIACQNHDNSSGFHAFRVVDLPAAFIVARQVSTQT